MTKQEITKEQIAALIDKLTISGEQKDKLKESLQSGSLEETVVKVLGHIEDEVNALEKEEKKINEEYDKEEEKIILKEKDINKEIETEFDKFYEKRYDQTEKEIEVLDQAEKFLDEKSDNFVAEIIKEVDKSKIEELREKLK